MADAGHAPGEPVRQHYNVTLGALALAGLAYSLQQTMVLPALPTLQDDLNTTTTWTTWIFTAFLLTSAVLTPILGKLGDQYGKERLLSISLGIFLVGSIGAATAWNIWSLIGWRALQGAGGAIFPLSFAIINDEFPREKAGQAIGAISAVLAAGGGLGLPLSGILVDYASWRWIFIIGAIAIAAALALVILVVPESPIRAPSRVDYPGAILLAAVLVSFLVAMSEGGTWGWTSARTLGLFALSAVLLPVWILVELRRPQPLVDMRMMAERTVLWTNITALLAGFALFGSFVIVPQFVQTPSGLPDAVARLVDYGFGATATQAGLILLPGSILGLFAGPLAGRMGRRFGYRMPLVLGMLLTSLGIAWLAVFHDEVWQVVVGMAVAGVGVPSSFAAMAKLVVDAVRPEETGVAGGMNTVLRTIGGVIGGQAMATLLTADTIGRTSVPAESAYTAAFVIGAVAAAVAVVTGLLVRPSRGREAAQRWTVTTAPEGTTRTR